MRCGLMFSMQRSCTPMTRLCRYSLPATGRRRPADSGPTYAMTALQARTPRLPYGSPTRRTAGPNTTGALERIGALYRIEQEVRGKPPDERRAIRQARAAPLLAELHAWMEKTLRALSPKSETAEAIRYALSRWRGLTRYVEHRRIEIDNSAAERALRAVALGRKNYLFCGSDGGA